MTLLEKHTIKEELIKSAVFEAKNINRSFEHQIANMKDKLQTIEESSLFKRYYESNNSIALQEYFLDIAKTSDKIMQLRLLALNGNEVIRIDRKSVGTTPFIISQDKLQNKKERYYFHAIDALQKDTFWYSKLDLNIEHHAIEKPLKPVVRVGTPLYLQNHKVGLLIINIFMEDFLKELRELYFFNVYLIDKDGYVLISPKKGESWGRYLKNSGCNLPFANQLREIEDNAEYYGNNFYATRLHLQNGEDIKIVLVPNKSYLSKKFEASLNDLLIAVFGVILLSFPLAYIMSILPNRLKIKVDGLLEELREKEKNQDQLLSLFDLSDSVLFKWNNDESWSVNFVSKSVEGLLGYTKEEFESNSITYASKIHPDDIDHVYEETANAIAHKEYFFRHDPYKVITKSNKIKWILDNSVVVRDERGEITHFLGYLLDITKLKDQEITLKKVARTDPLTQLYNRVYLDEVLMDQYYRYYRNHEECTLMIMDIDHFKDVNDTYGHLVGDKVLIEFSDLLKTSVRKGDVVGRWGGEEFLLILPHTGLESATVLAEKLQNEIRNYSFSMVGHKTASFGIATFRHKATVEDIVDEADKALYMAKEAGRDRIVIYKA